MALRLIAVWITLAVAPTLGFAEQLDLKGKVIDEAGKPLSVTVHAIRQSWPGGRFQQTAHETKTNRLGEFTFEKFHEAGQRVFIRLAVCDEGRSLTMKFLKNLRGLPIDPMSLKLQPAKNLTLKVVDDEGKPLSGVSVYPSTRETADGETHVLFSQSSQAYIKKTDEMGNVSYALFREGDTISLGFRNGKFARTAPAKIAAGQELMTLKAIPLPRRPSAGPPLPSPPAADRKHIAWIKQNAIPFRSIRPSDDDFSDLAAIGKLIGEKRIVLLGEQTHGDGACFSTKVRLIKYLHRELGFDVLAFESGLYDCREAWKAFRAGKPPLEAAQEGVFGIWTMSDQVRPLFEYLAEHAKGDKPLELAGVDCQFTARGSQELAADFRQFAKTLSLQGITEKQLATASEDLDRLARRKSPEGSLKEFAAVLDAVRGAALKSKHTGVAFWAQLCRSLKTQAKMSWSGRRAEYVSLRDEQMSENLVWLARQQHPKRKIIVWAASFHTMRNPAGITVPNSSLSYRDTKTMGHLAAKELVDEIFSIGFIAGRGAWGMPFRRPVPLQTAPAGTIEGMLMKADIENGLLPLHHKDADFLRKKLYARPLGHRYMRADWSRVFDALVFNKVMVPSTGRRP